MNFTIRQATIDDAAEIARVRITGWRESYAGLMPAEILAGLNIAEDEKRVRGAISDPANKSLRYVVEQNGRIVGMGACGTARGGDADVGRAEVYAIYLLNEAKRQGIGEAFMREMGAALINTGHKSLQVCVLENNAPARKFYEKLGGKQQKCGVFRFEGHELPDVTYVWADLKTLLA